MKQLWFHLMPYMELPSDFKEKHASVWVDVDPGLFDPVKANGMYNDFLDELEFAAEVGFDGVCVNEHHSNGYGLMPSPNLIAGFPVGTPMDTCYAYGQNPSQLRERYHEAHDLIVRAWAADEPFTWHGRYHQLRYVNPWPRPLQRPRPPIWIPGGGSVETWQWCAELDYVYTYLSYFGYKQGEATMRGFWSKMKEFGKDPNPFRSGFLQFVGVAETRAEALELYAEPALYFYERCLHVDSRWASPPGYASEATLRARVTSQVALAAERASTRSISRPGFEDIVSKGYVIVGSPDEVAEQLREVAVNLNVGQLMLLMQFGNMSKDLAFYNTELYAKRVAPQLRGLFEGEWENRWWPKPLPAAARASARELSRLQAPRGGARPGGAVR